MLVLTVVALRASAKGRSAMRSAVRKLLLVASFTSAVIGASGASEAASLSQTFTIESPITSGGTYLGTSFSQFNPTLGTLNSINLSISGTVTAKGPSQTNLNLVENTPTLGTTPTNFSNNNAIVIGSGSFSFGGIDTNASDIAAFTGYGLAKLGFNTFIFEGGTVLTVTSNSTVIYNYTPPPIVAVPGPIAGAGLVPLLGLAGALSARRRRQKLAA